MHIVLMTSSLGAGGAERVASTLCNGWVRRGYKVTLIATFSGGGKAFYPLLPEIKVIFLAELVETRTKSVSTYLRRFLALRKIISTQEVDVVISFLPNVNVAAIFSRAFTKVPVIVSERRDPASQPTSRFWEMACFISYRFSNAVVVQTEAVLSSIGTFYPALKKVVCIPNPIPPEIAKISRWASLKPRQILLSMCRLDIAKQVEHAVEAFRQLSAENQNWDFHIYGDGPAKDNLVLLINSLGLQNRVFLMGSTTSPWNVMAAADAFVMTSKREGFPNSLLEAMGIGLPCVVYDCLSGPREITCSGSGALLVPLNDRAALIEALSQVMGDEPFRKQLGIRAKACVLVRYEQEVILNQWGALFEEVGVSNL